MPFNGQKILTAMAAGIAYVAMRPVVENLGLDWATQLRKLKGGVDKSNRVHMNIVENERGGHMTTPSKFGCCDIAIPSKGGIQKMLCIPLKKLNGWLFSINPEKVRADIRDKLIQYQEECFTVLHDYWTKGEVKNPRKAKKSLPGKITSEQQEAIKQLVMNRGKALPKENQAKAMITMWSSIKSHFGCSYKEISDDQFTEALSIAARVPLEGEFLGKQEILPAPKFDVNIPLQWWLDNNPVVRSGNLSFGRGRTAPALDVTMDMLCGDNSTSAAIRLINVLEEAGFDVSAPKAEIVAMRKHLGNVEYGMKAIADACRRAGNKTISFRGGKAEYVIS
ncbi:phage antirepressor N-terminal domain-containing protein [Klebsiella aerogenes]